VLLEQLLDDVDRADDSSAKAPRRRHENAFAHLSALAARWSEARALCAPTSARPVVRGSTTRERARTFPSVDPFGFTAVARPPRGRSGESETALTVPASRPVAASFALSISPATAPVRSASRRRS